MKEPLDKHLTIRLPADLYKQLKETIPNGAISFFIRELIEKELSLDEVNYRK